MKRGFTLIELMLVVAIMGLLGTVSVGGYRSMRRGMEERGTEQNVNQFIRNAYQRAMIDRQPTAVYFWNETRRVESDTESLLVVGRAVAVRRAGRVSYVSGSYIMDEFGDLRYFRGTDEEGDAEDAAESKEGSQFYIYKVNGNETGRKYYTAGQATAQQDVQNLLPMLSDPDWSSNHGNAKILAYGYYLADGAGDWKAGDAYGFPFAELTLPNNYIFDSSYSTSVTDPIKEVSKVLHFDPSQSAGGQTVSVYVIRPGKTGAPEAQRSFTTEAADSSL